MALKIVRYSQLFVILTFLFLLNLPIFLTGQVKHQLQSIQDSIQKYYQNQPPKALKFAIHYQKLASTSDSLIFKAKADNFIGMCYYMNGDIEKAIHSYVSSLKKFEELNDTWFVAMLNNNIGAAYQFRKKPTETINYYLKALKGFEEISDTIWMANLYNNISIQKNELGLFEEDLMYKQKAMDIYIAQKDTQMILLTKGNLVTTYTKLGNYEIAIEKAEEFLNSPFNKSTLHGRSIVLLAYAIALQKVGNGEKAMQVLYEAQKISEENGFKEIIMETHQHLASLFEEQENYKQAYLHFKSFHNLQDTLFNQQKDVTINDLLVKYESDKKDADIVLLNAENKLKNSQIKQSNNIKWALGLGLILVSLLAFLAWRLKNIKSKTNIELAKKNQLISTALAEKNILLREIHHRVKNNLQVISSLLKLQSQYIEDEGAIMAIAEGRNRVHSMALLHQNLYKEDNLTGVNMKEYFTNLIEGLFDAYNINTNDVILQTEIEDLTLDIDTVIPLGLITNELVSNALKHAFKGNDNSLLAVKLWENAGRLKLQVKDNGKGYNPEMVAINKKSFGQKLIKSLSDKLEAEITIKAEVGTDIILSIKDYKKIG
jgi:two-component system, sensor histidine kinase PdtaS